MAKKTKYNVPWAETHNVPIYTPKTGDWRTERPVTNTKKCNQCGLCYLYCPTGCVIEADSHFRADLDYCKGCGICSFECPTKAIIMIREDKAF